MTSALQNRLVGTVILVALVVIFLPDFLDGKKEPAQEEFVSVPTTPAKKPIVDPEPFPSKRVAGASERPVEIVDERALDDPPDNAQIKAQDNQKEAANDNDLAAQTVMPEPEQDADDAAWVIQLGSFRHQKNVKQLLEKLEKAGYRAFSRPIQTSSGPLTKVFVGPEVNKGKLQAAVPHLKEVTGLKGKISAFKVE